MEPYRSYYPHSGLMLPATERLAQQVMTLPTGTAVDANQISTICQLIKETIPRGAEVHRRLEASGVVFSPTAKTDPRTQR